MSDNPSGFQQVPSTSGAPSVSETSGRRFRVLSASSLLRRLGRLSIYAYVVCVCIFLMAPILIIGVVSFHSKSYLVFPLEGYSLKWWTEALVRQEWQDAFRTSLLLALQATLISSILGTSAGLAIHYHDFKGKQLISVFFLSPLLLPQLLTGLALLFFLAQFGYSGTYTGLLLGHILVSFPYVVRLVLAALPGVSRAMEEAAMTLGANEFTTLTKITLPLIGPAVRGGAMFAFMASFNNVLISLFLSVARTTPMPIKIFHHIEWSGDPTVAAISTLFLLLTFMLLVLLRRTVGVELFPSIEQHTS